MTVSDGHLGEERPLTERDWGRAVYVLGVALIVLTVVIPLVSLWWWALFGITKPVGTACIFTPFITFSAGSALILLRADGAIR